MGENFLKRAAGFAKNTFLCTLSAPTWFFGSTRFGRGLRGVLKQTGAAVKIWASDISDGTSEVKMWAANIKKKVVNTLIKLVEPLAKALMKEQLDNGGKAAIRNNVADTAGRISGAAEKAADKALIKNSAAMSKDQLIANLGVKDAAGRSIASAAKNVVQKTPGVPTR